MSVAKQSYQFYKELPTWAKGAIAVGGLAILYFAGRSIFKKIKDDAQYRDNSKEASEAGGVLAELNKKGINQTLTTPQLESISLALVQAMDGCGTNEDAIGAQFKKIKNEADIYALIKIFGIRYYQPCAASQPISYIRWLNDERSLGGTISTWLNYELSASDINKYVNKNLVANGIKYQF